MIQVLIEKIGTILLINYYLFISYYRARMYSAYITLIVTF